MAAPEQHSRLTTSFFSACLENDSDPSAAPVDLFSVMKLLLSRRWALLRLSSATAAGFGIGMVYYGMPLGLTNLSFDVYLSFAFNALSELPSTLAAIFLVTKLNRRPSLLVLTTVSAVFSAAVCTLRGELWERLRLGLELGSFSACCTAFCVLLVYALELFPTCVRNSAVSMVRQATVLGGTFSPILVAAGRASGGALSYGAFGAVIGCCGLFAAYLPETRGENLGDTMEDEEVKMMERSQKSAVSLAFEKF